MRPREQTKHDLRCFCPRSPLLGVFGVQNGKRYVHVMVKRSQRVQAEILVMEGTSPVFLRCRECARMHRILFPAEGIPVLEEADDSLKSDESTE